MFVKALRLAGFKSFANPTTLEFERGVNVIVGPNGSGKSNIADALQWVLGSQAPTNLRGASMEDVIFAGSVSRPKLGLAEVSLTLDNSARILPLDIEEVTISRSTDRNGVNEYRINGAACRLLDIAELLSDTGIGRSIHTIVGQGQLDAVLQARAEDRRAFIEEAAQIGKYRKRKDRALRKLERVDDNLVRLNDVLLELRRAIRPLKRQAEAAAAYSELLGRHRDLRQRLAATEVTRLMRDEADLDLDAETERADLLADELSSVRARLEQAAPERDERSRAAERARTTAHRMQNATDRLTSLGRLAEERAERLTARLAAETEEGYRERIRLLEDDRARWVGEMQGLREVESRSRRRADEAKAAADEAAGAVEEAERRLLDARREETLASQALVRAEGLEAAARATVGSIEARVRAARERRDVAQQNLENDERDLQTTEREITTLEAELDRSTEAAAEAETRMESARERADMLRTELTGVFADVSGATARVETLKEIRSLLADMPEAVARLEPLENRAVEIATTARQGEEKARRLLEDADAVVERIWLEVSRHDEELRRLDALMAGAAERLAGVRRRREAREVELAALDDELSRAAASLAEAERSASEERAALPARRAAVEEMRVEREGAEARLSQAREAAAEVGKTAHEALLEARTTEERALAAQLRVEEAETGIADAQSALEGLTELRTRLVRQQERARAVARAAVLAARRGSEWVARAEAAADAAREAAEQADRDVAELRTRERDLTAALDQSNRRRNDAEVKRAEMRARLQSVGERAMDEWAMGLDDLAAIDVLDAEEEAAARDEVAKLDRSMKRLGAVNPNASDEYKELAERESFLEAQVEDLKTSRRDLLRVVSEVDGTIVDVFRQAYEDVAEEFERVFLRLFPGGEGRLKLTDPDDLLHTGIEIEARPPGKNVRKLSLLSGGERSLVALAFLFAIFRSRPSPFYLLDEVEAALDDINLLRFLGLIEELEQRAQVLVVTHQKRTMEAADILYGVSMAKDGVSHVIAKRLEEVAL